MAAGAGGPAHRPPLTAALWGIGALAFALRAAGAGYGLPHVYHQDEPIIVNHALAIGVGGWNTGFFTLPPFVIYTLFLLYGAGYALAKLAGAVSGPDAFALAFLTDPSPFYFAGRLYAGVVYGTLTVVLAGLTGWRYFGGRTGVLASLFLAVSAIHVRHSHSIYADVPLAFALALLLHLLFGLMERPSGRAYLAAGAALGWAVSVKYTAAYFLPACLVALGCAARGNAREAARGGALAAAAAAAVFLAVAPYTLLDFPSFWAQVRHQTGVEVPVGPLHHLAYSLAEGTGLPFLLLALFGIGALAARDRPKAAVLAAWCGVYYGVNTVFSQPFDRYMLAIVPALALLGALGWEWYAARLAAFPRVNAMVLLFILGGMLAPSAYLDFLFLRKDTRTQCLEWFEANVPEGSAVAVDRRFFGPRLAPTKAQIREKYAGLAPGDRVRRKRLDLALEAARGRKGYAVYQIAQGGEEKISTFLFERPFVAPDPAELEAAGVDYLVFNYSEPGQAGRLRERLAGRLEPVVSFSPYRDPQKKVPEDPWASTGAPNVARELFSRLRLGPYLEVYRLRKTAAT